jgi:hypothetical protein
MEPVRHFGKAMTSMLSAGYSGIGKAIGVEL